MSLGELIRHHLGDRDQKGVAAELGEEMNEGLKDETIVSAVSRLLNDNPGGARFFFRDPRREAALKRVLRVPESAWPPIRTEAERILNGAPPPARLVLDATSVANQAAPRDRLWKQAEALAERSPLLPVVVLVSRPIAGETPTRLVALEERVRVVECAPSEARAHLNQHAAEGALVLSPLPVEPFDHWAAVSIDQDEPVIGPQDAIERFAQDGKLPALHPVEHPLGDIMSPADGPIPKYPASPIERRALAIALTDEAETAKLKYTPHERLAIGKVLGVVATSMARERQAAAMDALIRELDLKPTLGTKEDLERAMETGRRKGIESTAFLVDGDLHLINPGAGVEVPTNAFVHVHRIARQKLVWDRLADEVGRWGPLEWKDDSILDRLAARLRKEHADHRELAHARTFLLMSAIRPKVPRAPKDTVGALRDLVGRRLPAVGLRIDGSALGKEGAATSYLARRKALSETEGPAELRAPRPAGGVLDIEVGEGVDLLSLRSLKISGASGERALRDQWIDAYEAFLAPPPRVSPQASWIHRREEPAASNVEVSVHPTAADLEREVGLVWLALLRALRSPEHIDLGPGRALLLLGSGVVAEIRIEERRSPGPDALRLSLEVPLERADHQSGYGWRARELLTSVPAWSSMGSASTTFSDADSSIQTSLKLPRRMILSAPKVIAELTFTWSPLFTGLLPGPVGENGAAIEAIRRQEEMMDDDD